MARQTKAEKEAQAAAEAAAEEQAAQDLPEWDVATHGPIGDRQGYRVVNG